MALGPVTYLDPQEARLADASVSGTYGRPWELWKKRAMARERPPSDAIAWRARQPAAGWP